MNFDQPIKKEVLVNPESKIKEGVDFVFEQNPELKKIGTEEQYSEYLNNKKLHYEKENNIKYLESITFQPIPKNLMGYLPTLEFRDSPIYQIQIKIYELFFMVEKLKKIKD